MVICDMYKNIIKNLTKKKEKKRNISFFFWCYQTLVLKWLIK